MPTRTSAWLVTLLAAVLAAATLASSASAATQRYASPAGSGTACSAAAPCTVQQAIDGASSGDEVIVSPGDYHLTSTLYDSPPITIHGVAGQPRPRLLFSGAGQAGMVLYHGSTLRYLEIHQAEQQTALFALSGAKLDQLVVKGLTDYFCTVEVNNSTMRNSIVVAPGSSGSVVCSRAVTGSTVSSLRNVTAVATGSLGVAIDAFAANGQTATINLANVIARGGPGGAGLEIQTNNDGATATISASHTNFANYWTGGSQASYVDGGGNQGTPPSLVSPATGDYRQAPGSVTVGAGLDAPDNGSSDFEGDPRAVGTTDIGADELVPAPSASTGAAGGVSDRSATVGGSVNPHGAPTTYRFEYGPTSAYGSTTPTAGAGSGMGTVAAGATVVGLSPATTYHFRVVATNAGGVIKGSDQTFTTSPPTPATPPPNQTTPPPTQATPRPTASDPTPSFAGVELVSRRLTFRRRQVTLTLRCPAGTVGGCSGRTTLSSSTATRVVLGRAAFSITAGTDAKVKVRVSRAGRRLLGRTRRLRARATNAARDRAGQARTTVTRVTVR
jgi:hypothetical protein